LKGTDSKAQAVRLLALYSETPVHPGTGQTTGVIDLPVAREKHTGFPIIPASGLKGSLREAAERYRFEGKDSESGHKIVEALFGPRPKTQAQELHAGAVAFGEGHVLAFPVRSIQQVFVWVTCPLVLERLRRDAALAGLPWLEVHELEPGEDEALITGVEPLEGTFAVEDLELKPKESQDLASFAKTLSEGFLPADGAYSATRAKFARHLLVVDDMNFSYLLEHCTQVTARVRLDEKKTTGGSEGNLWYEETLPRDTLFYALLRPERPRVADDEGRLDARAVASYLEELIKGNPYLQLGGNETVGQGWCAVRLVDGPAQGEADAG